MIQQYGIFFGCGEIRRFHHPAVQSYSVLSLEGKEFLLRYVVLCQGLFQIIIGNKCTQHLTGIVVQGNDGRSAQIRVTIHIVLHVRTELGSIDTGLCRQFGLFPFTVYLVYSFPQGAFFITGVVETVIVGIPA